MLRALAVSLTDSRNTTSRPYPSQSTRIGRVHVLALGLFVGATICAVPFGYSRPAKADDPILDPDPPNLPPFIDDFAGIQDLMGWTFEGRVLDESPLGMVVSFGGLLDGHSVTVDDADGYFYYTAQITENGTVTADTVDDQQQASNTASCGFF